MPSLIQGNSPSSWPRSAREFLDLDTDLNPFNLGGKEESVSYEAARYVPLLYQSSVLIAQPCPTFSECETHFKLTQKHPQGGEKACIYSYSPSKYDSRLSAIPQRYTFSAMNCISNILDRLVRVSEELRFQESNVDIVLRTFPALSNL